MEKLEIKSKEALEKKAEEFSAEAKIVAKQARTSVIRAIIIAIVIGITIYTGAIMVVQFSGLGKSLVTLNEKDLRSKSEVVITRIQNISADLKTTAHWASKDIADEEATLFSNGASADRYASYAVKKIGVEQILIVDRSGKDITSKSIYSFTIPQQMKTMALARNEVSDIIKTGTQIYVVVGVPIVTQDDKVIGAVFLDKKITTQEFVDELSKEVSCKITIFANYKRLFTSLAGMQGTEIANKTIVDTVLKGGTFNAMSKIGNLNYVTYYFPLKDNSGNTLTTLFLGVETNSVLQVSHNLLRIIIPFAAFLEIIFTIILLFMLVGGIVKPLKRVDNAISNLASGEADLTYRLPVKGNNEFAAISANVNIFIETLQHIISQIRETQQALAKIGETLAANSQESVGATTEILANIEGVRHQSENQTNSVSNTSDILAKSGNNVSELGSLIDDQASGITQSSASIEEMLGNINSVSESVKKMAESFTKLSNTVTNGNTKLGDVNDRVKNIANQSEMLVEANSIISQIAEQTNLLAMNAAIEAAHAGEAGKGFSVVADEIRKLAETSSAQSKSINAELEGITSSITQVVSSSEDAQNAFGEIVSNITSTNTIITEIDNAMTEQESGSRQILQALEDMKTQANKVRDTSKELQQNVQQVNGDMENVSQISTTILGSMDEMTSGAQEINTAAQSVNDLASQTQKSIGVMQQLLGKFKI